MTLVFVRSLPYTPHAILAGSFSYTARVSFSEEMILASFLYTPDASFSEEMNKLTSYMKENGLELSPEKPCLMLFNIQYNFIVSV